MIQGLLSRLLITRDIITVKRERLRILLPILDSHHWTDSAGRRKISETCCKAPEIVILDLLPNSRFLRCRQASIGAKLERKFDNHLDAEFDSFELDEFHLDRSDFGNHENQLICQASRAIIAWNYPSIERFGQFSAGSSARRLWFEWFQNFPKLKESIDADW